MDDMRAIVLIKQVPDLRGAPIGVRPDGTIDREAAGAVTNPADLHALEAALCMADEVWALSMGPPQAEAALREAVSLGASRAVLLCDRMLPARTRGRRPTPSRPRSVGSVPMS
jgi:electron transfer flavoprotein beta subunit